MSRILSISGLVFAGGVVMILSTSCYRMPSDDDYCVIPITNNRDLTGDTNATAGMPGLGY